jgi:hypothetical protein
MVRGGLVAVIGALALTSVPVSAKPVTTPTQTTERPKPGKKVARAKANKRAKSTRSKPAKTATKKAKAVASKNRRKRLTVHSKPRVKTSAKPLVRVAQVQSDGRVKYGPDRLPPGFAWPPTTSMVAASRACEQELDLLGVTWKPAPAEGMVTDPVVIPSMQIGGIAYTSAFGRRGAPTMECQFVRVLAQLGPELYGLGVREIQFGSIVRNTLARSHGQTKDFLSRHALGIAMDIRSFVDQSGRVATVEADYLKDDPLLHGIEELINARTQFRQVLTARSRPVSMPPC